MPRRARQIAGGIVYHVLNRAVGRLRLFSRDGDYEAFERVFVEAHKRHPVRLLGYCLMPTHWHLVLWPEKDNGLWKFMHWLTMTHTQRWRHLRKLVGLGPLYQGRYKSFPVQADDHLLVALRYVERNPLRADLVKRAQDWRFSSLYARAHKESLLRPLLTPWPIDLPRNYAELINQPQTPAEVEAIRTSILRGRPLGDEAWTHQMVRRLGLQTSMNAPHRPTRREGRK
jgi:putative transposase